MPSRFISRPSVARIGHRVREAQQILFCTLLAAGGAVPSFVCGCLRIIQASEGFVAKGASVGKSKVTRSLVPGYHATRHAQ